MGRRRERTGFGRRQVLQLHDSRRDDSPYRGQGGGGHWPARNEANALSGLMAHYGESEESSDEEDVTPPRTQPPPPPEPDDMDIPEPEERPVSPKPAAKENGFNMKKMGNVSLDIDSKVANFLAEIDALDADSNDIDGEPLPETDQAPEADSAGQGDAEATPPLPSMPSPPRPDPAQDHSDKDSADSQGSSEDEADDMPQAPTAPVSVWHHCQDENTQYFYYWNTATNEVTWEIPLEYSQYLLQIKEYEEALASFNPLLACYELTSGGCDSPVYAADNFGCLLKEQQLIITLSLGYEVQKTEFEEKRKNKPKKKKRHKGSSAVQKPPSNGRAAEVDPIDEEAPPLPPAEKKPVKSWLLKKIRETYGSKYDTEEPSNEQQDPNVASTYPADIGPQLPNTEIGPQLPPAEIEQQSPVDIGPQIPAKTEIGPQLPARTEIGPQLPSRAEIGPQLPARAEIGPQLPSRAEIGPQLPPPSEIGPQLPSGRPNIDLGAEIGPHLPPEEDSDEEAMIGPKMPPSLNFGSVPPPAELYGPPDVTHEADTDGEAAADSGLQGSRDTEFPDADSTGYGVAVGDTVVSGNGFPQELNNEAAATDQYQNPFSAPLLSTVGLDDTPLVFKKPVRADSDMEEDEEFDLDFIDKQLEEPLESQYIKKKTATTDEDVSHPLKMPKTDVKVKSILKSKASSEVNISSEVKSEAKVKAEVKIMSEVKVKAEVETDVKSVAEEEEDSDMEFDIDDIDQELEAALEKKKAEEKKTIKKEVVASPSKRKLSEESSSVGEKPKKAKILEKEKSPQPKKKMDKGEIKIKAEVADIATLIMDKLEFLDISRKGLSKLQMLLIEVETRIHDWREGALNTQYLLGRLEDAEQQLQQYESSAAPAGWACHWDRTYKRYFYFHLTTGASQWDYPDDDGASKDVTKSDAHSTAAEAPSSMPSDKVEPPQQVSSSQVDADRDEGGTEANAPLPQCAQVDSTTISTDATAGVATVSSSVTSTFNGKTEPTSSSVGESSSSTGASSAFAVDPSLFQDLFAPAPPPPAEPPPPGVESAPSSLTPPPPRPPPGLATSIPLSRSPPPPPPGTTPPPSTIEEVEMEISGMDATTSSLLAAAPPPPPPLDAVTSASTYQAPTIADQAPQYTQMVGAPMAMPPMVPPVIMAPPYISNTCTGMPVPVPLPVPQPPGSVATIVAPPVISGSGVAPAPVPPPPTHTPSATPPDTPPRNPVMYDPTLDGVPLVDSSHSSHTHTSTTAPAVSATATAAAAAQAKAEKKRKKEKKSAMGLSLKKKKLPSLVAKWEAVGRESSKHPKEEDSP